MKKFLLLIVIVLLAVGGTAYALSAPPAVPSLQIIVHETAGTVSVSHGEDGPILAKNGMTLVAGDVITTGGDGTASIEYFDGSRTVLDHDTRMTITQASFEDPNWHRQHIELTVDSGRVWARILKFLDQDSSFEIQHSSTVALVRGTAFLFTVQGFGVTADEATVIDDFDSMVEVSKSDGLAGGCFGNLQPGFSMTLEKTSGQKKIGCEETIHPTPDDVRNDHFVRAALKSDEEFATRATQARINIFKKEPSFIPFLLRQLGREIRLKLSTNPNELQAVYDRFNMDYVTPEALVPVNIGSEAGPFTMNEPNATHSNFGGVRVLSEQRLVTAGQTVQLRAFAFFSDGTAEKDVTSLATWESSDQRVGQISKDGMLRTFKEGTLTVVARWNDGTHEHSNTMTVVINPEITITNNALLKILQ